MSKSYWIKLVMVIMLVAVILLTTAASCDQGPTWEKANKICLAAGYSEVRGTRGDYYCYRRVDGTDEVVPLEDVGQ